MKRFTNQLLSSIAALALSFAPLAESYAAGLPGIPGNLGNTAGWQNFTPSLAGATDNPTATYTTQTGRFLIVGNVLFFTVKVVTSTMTKTTTSDAVQITLPVPVSGAASQVSTCSGRIENGTPVANAAECELTTGNGFLTFRYIPATTASGASTYAATAPGIGTLTNTITFTATGFYEF
jgi:hypothetical protein